MKRSLRVLLVEDSANDAELVLAALRDGGFEPTFERVETAAAIQVALARQSWDLVLADYRLPRFSAPAALALLQASGHDLPFIIVSGTVGEDVAVEAMTAGAQDYLLKNNLTRLAAAVERELRDHDQRTARRRAEEGWYLSEQIRSAVIEQMPGGVIVADVTGKPVLMSDAAQRILGVPVDPRRPLMEQAATVRLREAATGRPLVPAETPIAHALRGEAVTQHEYLIRRPDTGDDLWTEASAVPLIDAHKQIIGAVEVFSDITERKRAEAEARRLHDAERARRLELEVAHAELDRRHHELLAAQSWILGINSTRELPELVDHLALPLVHLLRARTIVVFPWHVETGTLDTAIGDDSLGEAPPLAALRSSRWSTTVLTNGQPLEIADLDTVDARQLDDGVVQALGWQAVVATPLVARGEPIGLLYVGWAEPHRLDERERMLLDLLAQHAALALADARHQGERAAQAAALQASEERFRTAFEHASIGMSLIGLDLRFLQVNQALCEILGYREAELLATTFQAIAHPDDLEAGLECVRQLLAGDARGSQMEKRYIHQDGHIVWAIVNVALVRDAAGAPRHFIAQIQDITARMEVEARLQYLAHYDPLTGLPNRMLFHDRLTHTLAHLHREQASAAVLFLDIDHFKDVNDSLGHIFGDRLLQAVAQRISAALRAQDTVSRLGGDEYTLFLPALADPRDAAVVAERVLSAIAQPFTIGDQVVYTTASIGIALYPDDGSDPETLLQKADTAMYRAKEIGRNTYHHYTAALTTQAAAHLRLQAELRQALQRGEFRLHYQPQVDLVHGTIVGVEALVRWEHPDHGLLPPSRFIAVAERLGLIGAIGEWVLRTACRRARAWQTAGLEPLRVGVNVSGHQVQLGLVRLVADALAESGLAPECLELELTESALMRDIDAAVQVLEALKALGVSLAIDDFGTGYSSLSYLQRFPVDRLKIDQSFVQGLPSAQHAAGMIRAIVTMAHILGLQAVAEGVETRAQDAFLRANCCDEAQGYLYARPCPATDLTPLLRQPFIVVAAESDEG